MRKLVIMLSSTALVMLLSAGGVAFAQDTDTTPPETSIIGKPAVISSNLSPSFHFTSSDANSTFQCELDGNGIRPCTSPKMYTFLSEGQHTFLVYATDAAGNIDPSGEEYTWTVDSFGPKVTFTQRPGRQLNPDDDYTWITDDRSPTWAWTAQDPHLTSDTPRCYFYDWDTGREIFWNVPCSSLYAFEGELPDGYYKFEVNVQDEAGNSGSGTTFFYVDTVAPQVHSTNPTGKRVSRFADVVGTFDDEVYDSKQFVNIYKKGSSTPLAVYRYAHSYGGKEIELDPKRALKLGTHYTVKVTTGVNDGANDLETPLQLVLQNEGLTLLA